MVKVGDGDLPVVAVCGGSGLINVLSPGDALPRPYLTCGCGRRKTPTGVGWLASGVVGGLLAPETRRVKLLAPSVAGFSDRSSVGRNICPGGQ